MGVLSRDWKSFTRNVPRLGKGCGAFSKPWKLALVGLLFALGCASERVHVDRGAFVTAGGKVFVPRGFNYIRLFPGRSHNTFDPEHYDAAALERALQRWQDDEFNVVRVFINTAVQVPGAIARKETPGLDNGYVRALADFLTRARRHHIGVTLCMESYPHTAPYSTGVKPVPPGMSPANAEYLEASRIAAKVRFLQDLTAALEAAQPGCLDAVFAWDLQNEFSYQVGPPFTLDSGSITTAQGGTYALPAQRQELADEGAIHFINQLADALHRARPGTLVGASVFTYAAVGRSGPGDFRMLKAGWQNRVPFRPQALLRSRADFLDVHFYSADRKAFERDLASVEFDEVRRRARETGKPLFVGEFGAFKGAFPKVEPAADWLAALTMEFGRRGFAGWLHWTYDTHEQSAELWHACDGESAIYRRLKDFQAR